MNRLRIVKRELSNNGVLFYSFLFAMLLIKAPPIYYIYLKNQIFSTHTLAKTIIFLLCVSILLKEYKKINFLIIRYRSLFLLLLLYFLGQSVSVLSAKDIFLFLKSYQNVVSAIAIFFFSFFIIKLSKKKTERTSIFMLFSGMVFIIMEFFYALDPHFMLRFFGNYIQQEVLDSYLSDLARGRVSLSLRTEIFVPFFLYAISNPSTGGRLFKVLMISFLLLLSFLSLFSNFRSRAIVFIFSIFLFLILRSFNIREKIVKTLKQKSTLLIICISFLVSSYFALSISTSLFTFNILDRFSLTDEYGGGRTIVFRINSFERSLDFFQSSPIIGVGLGNYTDPNLIKNVRYSYFSTQIKDYQKRFGESSAYSPHNIIFQTLSETGIVGFIPYLALIFYFLIGDYKFIRGRGGRQFLISSYIISSWSLFIFMNVEPAATIFMMGWFWFMRGIIEANR